MNFRSDFSLPQAMPADPASLLDGSFSGGYPCVLTTDRADTALLEALAEQYGDRLVLPECWQRLFPRCGVLLSSALCGGRFSDRVSQAPKGRSWLLLEPMAMTFPLPCPTGCGTEAAIPDRGPVFFSEALLCQYTHFLRNGAGYLTLWDTEQTLRAKLALAQQAGFCGFVPPVRQKTPQP